MIEYKNVFVQYQEKMVLQDISIRVEKNQKIIISGKSGCGKTTLFRLMLGFARQDSGQVFFDGVELDERFVWNVRENIAYVSQDLSIGSGIAGDLINQYLMYHANTSLSVSDDDIQSKLALFELDSNVLGKSVNDLSGGEKQRLSIVIACLLKRDVYLLDEATSFLDKNLKNKVSDYFLSLKDKTVVIISHDNIWLRNGQYDRKIYDLDKKQWR